MALIHSSEWEPRYYPKGGASCPPVQIDRIQDLTGSISLNRERIKEVGREGVVGWKTATPTVSVSSRQLEYGNIEFWQKLANTTSADTLMIQTDFKTAYGDIVGYQTDDDGTFKGSVVYPALRLSGFSVNISDPDALIERNMSFVGEDRWILQGDNKYYIQLEKAIESGEEGDFDIVIGSGDYANYPDPVNDPDESAGVYILSGVRIRDGLSKDLVLGTDYTYDNGTTTITCNSTEVGDTWKFYYSATTYISGDTPFTNNDSDAAGITAENCSIYLNVNNYAYKLQSVGFDVTFDRTDQKEIGSQDVVARGIRNTTCRLTLGKTHDGYDLEEILRGVTAGYGKIDARNYADDISVTLKVYDSVTKDNFLLAYEFTNLSPVTADDGAPVDDYVTKGITMEGEEFKITSSEGDLAT